MSTSVKKLAAVAILIGMTSLVGTAVAGPGGHYSQGGDGQAAPHMGHMNDVLQQLKRDLGKTYYQEVPDATREQLALGKNIFSVSCVVCHGDQGRGDGPAAADLSPQPADFTAAEHARFYSDRGRLQIIKKGVDGTSMSGWEDELDANEIMAVHAYIRSLRTP